MAGAYSQDLRDRVINAVVVEGMSRARRRHGSGSAGHRPLNGWSGSSEAARARPQKWAATNG